MRVTPHRRQRGITSVEFSIVGVLLFMLLFGVLEIGRLLSTFAVLAESTRRAARLATVCQPGDAGITSTGQFGKLPGFTSTNLQIQYLTADGTITDTTPANYGSVRYVRAQVSGYSIALAIPLVNPTIAAPAFAVT